MIDLIKDSLLVILAGGLCYGLLRCPIQPVRQIHQTQDTSLAELSEIRVQERATELVATNQTLECLPIYSHLSIYPHLQ